MVNFGSLENYLGFSSLLLFIFTLWPSVVRITLPSFRKTKFIKFLTKRRREVGILAWVFGFLHGTIIIIDREVDFSDIDTWTTYFQGIAMISIFTILAITSNDYSQKKMKKSWKSLHRLNYVVLFILPWHVIDKMNGNWTILTPLGLSLLFITLYFMLDRWWIEYEKNKEQRKT